MTIEPKRWELLTQEEVKWIHEATLSLLDDTGVGIQEESTVRMLKDLGAVVDVATRRVRFPPDLLMELVSRAPSQFVWAGAMPERDIHLGTGKVHLGTTCMAANFVGLDGKRRSSTFQDAEDVARLLDALEWVDEGGAALLPQDVPVEADFAYYMLAGLKHSTKPLQGRAYGHRQAELTVQLSEIAAGSLEQARQRPRMMTIINPVSPLSHHREPVEGIVELARHGLPMIIAPEVQSGATGPVTLAGSIVQHNAEVLSGIAIAQAVRPGTPVLYGQVSGVLDLRLGTFPYGAIEHGMMDVAMAQVARYYGLPSRADGGHSDSKVMDMQAGLESAMTSMLAALGGNDYIFGVVGGTIESTLVVNIAKMVVDNEIAGMIRRLLRGVEVTQETTSLNLIREVGPGGHYLGQKHTMRYLRSEHFLPTVVDRQAYPLWLQGGAKDIEARACERAEKILQEHHPQPLDQRAVQEMEKLVHAFAEPYT